MYHELKPDITQLMNDIPNGYMNRIKKEYPHLINHINTLPYGTLGERFFRWYHDDIVDTCKLCGGACNFKQFSYGYYEFCSASCRATFNQSFKNAHTPDGKCKGAARIREAAATAVSKRKSTVEANTGLSLGQYSTLNRQESYYNNMPDKLKDVSYCSAVAKSMSTIATELDVPVTTVKNAFKRHGITPPQRRQYSDQELAVGTFLTTLGVEYERNVRGLLKGRQEIDIYVPELKLGIEYCGLFWHSDRNNYPPSKHFEKFMAAREAGITLITLFEDEWLNKRDTVQSRLTSLVKRNHSKIGARSCKVDHNLPASHLKPLLNRWHIAGARSCSQNICLTHLGEVLAILTYGKPRYTGDVDIEIIRYATKPGITVTGGFSKLFTALKKLTNCKTVVSYSDNRWGSGGMYEQAGFTNGGNTPPSYFYFTLSEGIRMHRSAFMKHKIVQKMNGDCDLTEYENMKKFGYNRIYDCGTTRWVWTSR